MNKDLIDRIEAYVSAVTGSDLAALGLLAEALEALKEMDRIADNDTQIGIERDFEM